MAGQSAALSAIPPPSANVINLAIASIIIHAILLPFVAWTTWKHGKRGMVCWPIFLSFFLFRFLSNGWQLRVRNEPDIPNAVSIFTNAGIFDCLLLTLLGITYEACLLMPIATSPWVNRGFLGFTHLLSTAGIAMATYGGSPSASGSVANPMLDKVGNCIILCTILILIGWLVILGRRIAGRGDHPYARPTKTMFYTACAGVPFQSLRSAYATTYAFTGIRSLDPFTGSFATRLVLMFMFELAVTLIATVGGWMTRHINDEKEIDQQPYTLDLVDTVE